MFIYNFFLFNKTISLFYSLFGFRISYKIIVLSSLNLAGRGLAGRGLTRLWPAGMGLKLAGRDGPGRAWAKHSRSGLGLVRAGPSLGLNSSLRAWAGPGLKNCCGPGPGLGLNSSLRAWTGPGL